MVVAAGVTGRELASAKGVSAGSVRGSGVMLTLVPFCTDHVMVAIVPAVIVVGAAVNVMAGAGGFTVTVTLADVLPPGPVAVNVYVAVPEGVNVAEPLIGNAPEPAGRGSGESETDVALLTDQVSVTAVPEVTPVADDENDPIDGGCCCGGGGGGVAPPAPPQAVKDVSNSPNRDKSSSLEPRDDVCTDDVLELLCPATFDGRVAGQGCSTATTGIGRFDSTQTMRDSSDEPTRMTR